MRLKEWGWNEQRYVEVEYPDEVCARFIEWFRNTKAWREAPELCYNHWLKFERDLTDAKNSQNEAATSKHPRCTANTASGSQCKHDALRDGLCGIHLRAVKVA